MTIERNMNEEKFSECEEAYFQCDMSSKSNQNYKVPSKIFNQLTYACLPIFFAAVARILQILLHLFKKLQKGNFEGILHST